MTPQVSVPHPDRPQMYSASIQCLHHKSLHLTEVEKLLADLFKVMFIVQCDERKTGSTYL